VTQDSQIKEERRKKVHEAVIILQKVTERLNDANKLIAEGENFSYDDDFEAINKALLFLEIAYDELENII
jgi:hypothetical protein